MRVCLCLCLALSAGSLAAEGPSEMYRFEGLNDGTAAFRRYSKAEPVKRAMPNLRLSDGLETSEISLYHDVDDFRTGVLSAGQACLVDIAKATTEEIELQARAGKCPSAAKVENSGGTPTAPSWWSRAAAWMWSNWEKLFGIGALVLIAAGVMRLIRAARAAAARKAVDLIIAGVPAAGKSALYKRLVNPDVDKEEIDKLEPSSGTSRGKSESIAAGKFTFFPRLKDLPGSFLGAVIDEFATKKTVMGYQTTKTALVVVLAPVGLRKDAIAAANADYVAEQYGWSTLIQGITQSERLHRPDLIAIFLNKCDLYEGSVRLEDVEPRMRADFARVLDAVKRSADRAKIPIIIAFGSARLGIGTGDLLGKITRKLAAGRPR